MAEVLKKIPEGAVVGVLEKGSPTVSVGEVVSDGKNKKVILQPEPCFRSVVLRPEEVAGIQRPFRKLVPILRGDNEKNVPKGQRVFPELEMYVAPADGEGK